MTANILHDDQRHLYMMTIFMQMYVMTLCGAFHKTAQDFEVCTVSQVPYEFFHMDVTVSSLIYTSCRLKSSISVFKIDLDGEPGSSYLKLV